MKIYIDSEFRCHTTNSDGNLREIETEFFDGKCETYIEGMRYIPPDETWIREDGEVFTGEMKSPWKKFEEIDAAQIQYESDLLKAAEAYQEGVDSAYDQ